jgi:hypothetical protein
LVLGRAQHLQTAQQAADHLIRKKRAERLDGIVEEFKKSEEKSERERQ